MYTSYYILIAVVTLMALANINNRSHKANAAYNVIFVLILLFCILRDPFRYPDILNYDSYFKSGETFQGSDENINIGYTILNQAFKIILNNFYLFGMVVCGTVIFIYSNFIKKYSTKPCFSILLFVLIVYFSTFFLYRQVLASACGVVAFKYVLDKNFKWTLIWSLVAVSFHTSAAIILPVYFIYNIPKTKLCITVLGLSAIAVTLLTNQIAAYFLSSNEWYSMYLNSDYEASPIRLFMKVYILALYLWIMRQKALEEGLPFLVTLCLAFECILYWGSAGIDGVYRMKIYFDLGEIIGIPLMMSNVKGNKYSSIMTLCIWGYNALLFLACFQFITGGCFDSGYSFFF